MRWWLTSAWFTLFIGMLGGAFGQPPSTPCEWFDHNGDGILGANTWLYVLGQYGTSTEEMDLDDNGMVDLRDLLQFLPYYGEQCPVAWTDTTSGHILDLLLVEYAVHNAELAGLADSLPAGSVTYWLYAQLAEPTDGILSMYGDDAAPLTLETDGSFYGFGTGPGEAVTIDNYNPIFNSFVPANEFMTWFTLDEEPGDNWNTPSAGFITGTADATDGMADAGLIQINDSIGGGSFFQGYCCDSDGLVLLGQFTVVGFTTFSGMVNLLAETAGSTAIEFAEGMTFSSSNLAVFGCMDPEALNFDSEATHDPFSDCAYAGDFNGDGAYTVEDLLELLADFGCTTCPQGDLNGDGVVSVQDILLFLTWI